MLRIEILEWLFLDVGKIKGQSKSTEISSHSIFEPIEQVGTYMYALHMYKYRSFGLGCSTIVQSRFVFIMSIFSSVPSL